ncbi:MAG: metalloregulator ArsR/SmtB family transcription factor [Rhodospirillaceae bacterium]
MEIVKVAKRLEALGNPTRLSVYRILVRAGEGGLAVGDLQRQLDIPASTLSHHLHRLIAVDLVVQERQSTTLICRTNYASMQATLGFLSEQCCADAPAASPRSLEPADAD